MLKSVKVSSVCPTCSSCDFSWLTKSRSCRRCLDRSRRSARTEGELALRGPLLPEPPLPRFLREDMLFGEAKYAHQKESVTCKIEITFTREELIDAGVDTADHSTKDSLGLAGGQDCDVENLLEVEDYRLQSSTKQLIYCPEQRDSSSTQRLMQLQRGGRVYCALQFCASFWWRLPIMVNFTIIIGTQHCNTIATF